MTRTRGSDNLFLAEVPEASAVGSLADVYADIRRVLGVAHVVLVYRALAAQPGRLERVWSVLRPNLASAQARSLSTGLSVPAIGSVVPVPVVVLEQAALDPGLALGTLRSFERSNRLNLIGLQALLHGAPGTGEKPQAAEKLPALPMLKLPDLDALPNSTIMLLEEISEPIAGSGRPIVIPSLFRHFANDEPLLAALWTSIRDPIRSPRFQHAVTEVEARARCAVAELPAPLDPTDDGETHQIISRFSRTIPAMIVATRLIEAALMPADGTHPG
jgi:hypothetical protein